MCCQTKLPLFSALTVNVEAIEDNYPDLTHEDAIEVAELFEGYLTDADAWELAGMFAYEVFDRNHPVA